MLRVLILAAGAWVLCSNPGLAGAPTEQQLDAAVRLGTVATLAPLCGVRDDAWAADLRRATVQQATGSQSHDDAALRRVPGSDAAIGALSYAEAEALEDFATTSPAARCGPLAHNIELERGDAIVRAFRRQVGSAPGS